MVYDFLSEWILSQTRLNDLEKKLCLIKLAQTDEKIRTCQSELDALPDEQQQNEQLARLKDESHQAQATVRLK